jgi:hypothetical protein
MAALCFDPQMRATLFGRDFDGLALNEVFHDPCLASDRKSDKSQTFSERALDFSEERVDVVQQNVPFCPKSHTRRFPRKPWNWGRFPKKRWIFPSRRSAVWGISCSFHSEEAVEIPFHRLLGKEALSIACSEKVRVKRQHLRVFHRILPALPRKNPALPRKKSGLWTTIKKPPEQRMRRDS